VLEKQREGLRIVNSIKCNMIRKLIIAGVLLFYGIPGAYKLHAQYKLAYPILIEKDQGLPSNDVSEIKKK